MEFWFANDTLKALEASCRPTLSSVRTGEIWSKNINVRVGANEGACVWKAEAKCLSTGQNRVPTARSPQFPANRHLLAPIKDIPVLDSLLTFRIAPVDSRSLPVSVTSVACHYGVRLDVAHPTRVYSDNCFDLMAGETRALEVGNPQIEILPGDLFVRTAAPCID